MDSFDETIEINQVSFSQDRQFILLSTSRGLSVVSCRTFEEVVKIETFPKPVLLADMVAGTSLLGAVVGEEGTHFQLFNGKLQIASSEMEDRILNLRLNLKRILVLTESRFFLFDLAALKLLLVIDRCSDFKRIPAVSLPLLANGGTYVSFVSDSDGGICTVDSYTLFQSRVVCPHTSAVSALAIDESVMATASTKGTLVRVFRVPSMDLLCVFRRGRTESPIKSLEISHQRWLCVTGESDTAHIFKIPALSDPPSTLSRLAIGAALRFFPQHYKDAFEAVRDFAYVRLRPESGYRYIAAWREEAVVVVSEQTGFAFVYQVNAQKGGECKLVSEFALLSAECSQSPVKASPSGEEALSPAKRIVSQGNKSPVKLPATDEALPSAKPVVSQANKSPVKLPATDEALPSAKPVVSQGNKSPVKASLPEEARFPAKRIEPVKTPLLPEIKAPLSPTAHANDSKAQTSSEVLVTSRHNTPIQKTPATTKRRGHQSRRTSFENSQISD